MKVTITKVGDRFEVRCRLKGEAFTREFGSLSLALQWCKAKGYSVNEIKL